MVSYDEFNFTSFMTKVPDCNKSLTINSYFAESGWSHAARLSGYRSRSKDFPSFSQKLRYWI